MCVSVRFFFHAPHTQRATGTSPGRYDSVVFSFFSLSLAESCLLLHFHPARAYSTVRLLAACGLARVGCFPSSSGLVIRVRVSVDVAVHTPGLISGHAAPRLRLPLWSLVLRAAATTTVGAIARGRPTAPPRGVELAATVGVSNFLAAFIIAFRQGLHPLSHVSPVGAGGEMEHAEPLTALATGARTRRPRTALRRWPPLHWWLIIGLLRRAWGSPLDQRIPTARSSMVNHFVITPVGADSSALTDITTPSTTGRANVEFRFIREQRPCRTQQASLGHGSWDFVGDDRDTMMVASPHDVITGVVGNRRVVSGLIHFRGDLRRPAPPLVESVGRFPAISVRFCRPVSRAVGNRPGS